MFSRVCVAAAATALVALTTAAAASATSVTAVTGSANPSTAAAAASYTVSFTPATSETIGSTITVEAAPGTTFTACSSCAGYYDLVQGSTAENITSVAVQAGTGSATTNRLVITLGLSVIWGGTPVTLVAPATNTSSTGTQTLRVWTAADTTPVSASYAVGLPAGGLRMGAYPQSPNSPAYLQSLFGTPTGTMPTLGSEYLPSGTWTEISGAGTLGPSGSSSIAYLQSVEHWSTPGSPAHSTPGYQLVLGVAMLPSQACTPACTLAAGANGDYNQYYQQLATTLVNEGLDNAWLRLGWEFDNGTTYPWSATTPTTEGQYAAYFRQIVATMRAVTGAHFKFVWNPDGFAFLGPNDPVNLVVPGYDVTLAWPGASYVDYIGLDLYDQTGWATAANTWGNYIAPQLAAAKQFASSNGVPLAFPEWGVCAFGLLAASTCQNDDPTYIHNMHSFMTTPSNNVAWENYFNVSEFGWNSAITGGAFPNSLAAFKADFA